MTTNKKTRIDVILGAASFGTGLTGGALCESNKEVIQQILDEFKSRGHHTIDNARGYSEGTSESILAEMDYAGQGFIMDTKIRSVVPGSHSKENLNKSLQASLQALKTTKVNTLYLHMPDRATPFEETLSAIDEAHKQGYFEQFGISNYSPNEVEQIVKICKEKSYVSPTVYQGMYNLVVRGGEADLFPILRKHGIRFYAYSPLGGGFLTSDIAKDFQAPPNTRFDDSTRIGTFYKSNYFKESYFQVLETLKHTAEKHGITVPEIALRWIMHHSALSPDYNDAVITSSTKLANLRNALELMERPPLPVDVLATVEAVWNSVKNDAAQYHR